MARRLDKTLADYVTIALSPALIMLLVGSLMYFLLLVGSRGQYQDRIQWIMSCFVLAIVLIARISMEEGKEKAMLYGLALTGAMALAIGRFTEQAMVAWLVLAVVWWSANKLTWDCTFIDEQEDASGEGLLQVAGLDEEADQATAPAAQAQETTPADTSLWRRFMVRRRKKTSAPGVWVVYYSLAALPIFGLGQRLVPAENLDARRMALLYLIVYVGSALGLLLTTSFLGLRRYLRQRKLQMPRAMAGLWLGCGAALIVLVLAVCAVVPRPSPEYAAGSFTGRLTSKEQEASRYAVLRDSATKDPSGEGAPGQSDEESSGRKGEQGKGQGGQQGESSKGGGESEGSQGKGSQGEQGQGSQSSKGQSEQGAAEQSKSGESSSQSDQATGEQQGSQSDASQSDSTESQSSENQSASSESAPQPSSWMPDLSGGLFMLGRWILNLVLIVAVLFIVIRYWRQLATGFAQLWKSWQAFLALLFGRKPPEPDKGTIVVKAPPLPSFADFPNPFRQTIRGVRTPEEYVAYSFRALEAWAAEHELDRRSQETPWEFADRLGGRTCPAGAVGARAGDLVRPAELRSAAADAIVSESGAQLLGERRVGASSWRGRASTAAE